MDSSIHISAKASHYTKEAEHYDSFNEENSKIINTIIEKILKNHNVKTVLDLTCGTGSQVFWLTKAGFEVVGADINAKMLKIAKEKAHKDGLKLRFIKGDMRTLQIGQFDAVITIFNAIGHLTKSDFEKALTNIHSNLKDDGIYIFDIYNLLYLLEGNNITKLTIDWQTKANNITARAIQYSTINKDGILASYTIVHEQKGNEKPRITKDSQTLQVYSADQLKDMLQRRGFIGTKVSAIDGSEFSETKTERMLIVARKKGSL